MKRFCFAFLALLSLSFSSCNFMKEDEIKEENKKEFIPVEKIEFDKPTIEIEVGQSAYLNPTVSPSNATNKKLIWSVNDYGNIQFFSSTGLIEGLKPGKAFITASSENNRSIFAECEILVKEGPCPIQTVNYTYDNYTSDYGSESISHIDSCPAKGNPNLLVIPIWFTDSNKYIKEDKKNSVTSDIKKAYFGTSADTGWQSVSSFYQIESKGKCNITGTVAPWYNCNNPSSAYTNHKTTVELVKEATENYFSTSNDKKDYYDTNRDGYYDGIVLIYGAPDCQQADAPDSIKNNSNLWALCDWVQETNTSSTPIPNTFFWASYDFLYDSTKAFSRAGTNYGSGICKNVLLDTHTFIHEAGHLFGLEDYYCYNNIAYPAGAFSMQDYNVGGHDPFSLLSLGWINPYLPTSSCEITLSPFQDGNHQTILLTPRWNSFSSVFDEYLLLEFYTPTGLNKLDVDYRYSSNAPRGVDGYGIRLWHVDARLTYSKYKDTNNQWVYSTDLINSPTEYTSNANSYGIRTAMSNTYYSSSVGEKDGGNKYITPLGQDYCKYNLLELIRKTAPTGNYATTVFSANSLYVQGDTFNIDNCSQFKNSGKLNSGKSLGFSFKVQSITTGDNPKAVIQITKL